MNAYNTIKNYIENTHKVSFLTIINPIDLSFGFTPEEVGITLSIKILHDSYIELFSDKKTVYNIFIIKNNRNMFFYEAYLSSMTIDIYTSIELEFNVKTFEMIDQTTLEYYDRMSKLNELLN